MPYYDPRDNEEKKVIVYKKDSKGVKKLKKRIAKLEAAALDKEVKVCKIMSFAISLLNQQNAVDLYKQMESNTGIDIGLFEYQLERRKEDQKFYIKELKKQLKKATDKTIKAELKEEIQKAKSITLNIKSQALWDRNVFSSKFLTAAH